MTDTNFDICIRRWQQNEKQPLLGLSVRDPRINYNSDRENEKVDGTMTKQTNATTQSDVQFQRFAIIADDFLFSMILERTLFAQQGKC